MSDNPILPARLKQAASKRTKAAVDSFLQAHKEYVPSVANRALFTQYFSTHGILVPGEKALSEAFAALHDELELAPEAIAVRHISLKGLGPKVHKVSFSI